MKKPASSSGKQPRQHETVNMAKFSSVDPSVLGAYRELQQPGGPDFVTELIDLFLDDTTSQLRRLRAAVSNKDGDEIRRVAHLLKGSSGNIGAGRMAKLFEELEEQRDSNTEDTPNLLARIEIEFELVREVLQTERHVEKP
jgi:HPt (histidine-containing phosphotransfer) domain-containing protein